MIWYGMEFMHERVDRFARVHQHRPAERLTDIGGRLGGARKEDGNGAKAGSVRQLMLRFAVKPIM